jgi:hypothetical protein
MSDQESWDKFYNSGQVDFSDMYSGGAQLGSGSDHVDNYLGGMMALADMGQSPDLPAGPTTIKNTEDVKSHPYEDVRARVATRAKSVLAESVQGSLNTLSELYAQTGDPATVEQGQQLTEELANVDKLPLASQAGMAALAALKKEGLNDVDRMILKRHAELAMVGEFVEAADPGVSDILGTMIPLRNSYQLAKNGGLDALEQYKDKIRGFRAMLPEDQIKALPQIMQDVYKMSGENALIFQDRILPFIDRDDISKVYDALAWDAFDAATILPMSKVFRFMKSAANAVRFARDLKAGKTAGKMVADAAGDASEATAKSMGTDRISAGASSFPFGGEGVSPEIIDGLSPDAQSEIVDSLTQGRAILNKVIYDPNLIIKRSPLTDKEIADTQKKYMEQFGGNAKITDSDPLGFTVEFEVKNPKYHQTDFSETPNRIAELQGDIQQYQSRLDELTTAYKDEAKNLPEYTYIDNIMLSARKELAGLNKDFSKGIAQTPTDVVTKKLRYNRDDVGVLDATEINLATPALNSPEFYINQMLKDAVSESTAIGFTQQQFRNFFEEAANKYLKGMPSKAKQKVSSILLQADRDKISRYSTADLMSGVATKEGLFRLETPEEILAYHGVRDVFDTAYLMKNRQLRRELEFDKWQAVRLNSGGDKVVSFVKPAVNENGQVMTSFPEDVKKIYDFATDKFVDVGSAEIMTRRMQNEGWQLLKSKYPVEVGDELVEYVLAKPTNVKRLPDRVLTYRPGYVPRIYKNVFYVAERAGQKIVNGVKRDNYKEVARYFDSEGEAKQWATGQNAKGESITVRPGQEWLEMHPDFKQDYEAAVFGGMYSGKRTEEVIPFGLEGQEGEHLGAFEAMEKAMSHVSTRLPINEFRMGMIRRFVNTARDPVTGKSLLQNPGDWRSPILLPPTSKEYTALKSFRDWMEDQFRIPTAQERYFGSLMARWAGALERRTGNLTRSYNWKNFNPRIGLLNLGHKDVFGSMRGLAFHALLGWFNPAQLYVQALGASMAVSVSPAKAAYLIPRSLAMRAAMFSDKPEVWMRTWVSAGLSPHEGEELVRAFRKSGVMDSVKSTADFDAMVRGYGMTRSAFSRAADKGLIFFREGETMVRTYGWLLAHDEFVKKLPDAVRKTYKLTDKDIDAVTKRSLSLTMNLNRANRAYWQKGVLSIPTQFMQITAKFVESMAYNLKSGRGTWTPAEKAKILAGQVVMFGAAGIPFGQWAAQGISEWAGSDDDYGLGVTNPDAMAAIRGGLMEWAAYAVTGEHLSISQRVSIPAGIETFIDTIIREDSTLGEKVAGAFGEVPGRFYEAANDLLPLFVGYTKDMENFESAPAVVDTVSELSDVVSSFRNIHKAFMWEHQKAVLDNKGNPLVPLDPEEDWSLIGAKALGMEPRVIEDYYNLSKYNSLSKKDLTNVADAWIKIARKYAGDPQMASPKGRARVGNMISFLNRGLTEEQRAKVAESVMRRLKDNEYKVTQELLDAVENVRMSHGKTVAGYKGSLELNTLMVPAKKTDNEDAKNAE